MDNWSNYTMVDFDVVLEHLSDLENDIRELCFRTSKDMPVSMIDTRLESINFKYKALEVMLYILKDRIQKDVTEK